IAALASEARRLVDTRAPGTQLQWDAKGKLRLIKIAQLAQRDPAFIALAHSPPLVDAVEQILGPGARLFRDVVVGKPAFTGGKLSEHQDSAYWDVEPKALVSAWVALTDAPIERSPLEVVAGTHRNLLPHGLVIADRFEVPRAIVKMLRSAISAAGTGD